MGKLTISMAMFNSYVKLPEGMGSEHDMTPYDTRNVAPRETEKTLVFDPRNPSMENEWR